MLRRADVGAKRVEDSIVWQLANELRENIHAMVARGPASDDWRFRSQLQDAAVSITRNISEGFGRFGHREFAQFLVIARGSLFELEDHLRDGIARKYWSEESTMPLRGLCRRTTAALTSLIRYLRSNPNV